MRGRPAGAVGAMHRLRCGARPPGARQNSLRSLRSLRSDSCRESVYEARQGAPPGGLRSSPPQRACRARTPCRAATCRCSRGQHTSPAASPPAVVRALAPCTQRHHHGPVFRTLQTVDCKGRPGCAAWRVWCAEHRRPGGRARSAHQDLTHGDCLTAAAAGRGGSFAMGPHGREAQGSRSAAQAAPAVPRSAPRPAFAAPHAARWPRLPPPQLACLCRHRTQAARRVTVPAGKSEKPAAKRHPLIHNPSRRRFGTITRI